MYEGGITCWVLALISVTVPFGFMASLIGDGFGCLSFLWASVDNFGADGCSVVSESFEIVGVRRAWNYSLFMSLRS